MHLRLVLSVLTDVVIALCLCETTVICLRECTILRYEMSWNILKFHFIFDNSSWDLIEKKGNQ